MKIKVSSLLCYSALHLIAFSPAMASPTKITSATHTLSALQGKLEIRAALYLNGQHEAMQYLLHQSNGKLFQLRFENTPPPTLKTDQVIYIKKALYSISKPNELIVSADDVTIIKNVFEMPDSFGEQRAAVFAVNFQDQPDNHPWTLDDIKEMLVSQVDKTFYESSYHQTTFKGDVLGWFTIPINSTDDCNYATTQIAGLAQQAARNAGIDLTPYNRFMYIFPQNPTCLWAGLGTVGGQNTSVWFNGYNADWVATHELGHNFGLAHSKLLNCPGSADQGTCTRDEYGDGADTMGSGGIGHFNAFQKEILGWLNFGSSPPITTVTRSGTYFITPYEITDQTTKALKILKSKNADRTSTYYYLEYRQPIGADIPMSQRDTADFTKGVTVHQGNPSYLGSSDLLDMSPEDKTPYSVALLPGKTFTNGNAANGGVSFTVNSISPEGASVTVNFGVTAPCTPASPVMRISPDTTQWIDSGQSATYTVNLANQDEIGCPATTFALSATDQPSNRIMASIGAKSLSLKPGENKDLTVTVKTSNRRTPAGEYTIPVQAIDDQVDNHSATVTALLGVN